MEEYELVGAQAFDCLRTSNTSSTDNHKLKHATKQDVTSRHICCGSGLFKTSGDAS